MVVLTAAALTTACTGGSSGGSPSPAPTPTAGSAAASSSPDTIGEDATASLTGSATITLGSSAPVTVKAGKADAATLDISPSGRSTVDLAMHDSSDDVFSLSGVARTGAPVTDAHVAILLSASGVIVDTSSGNPCRTSYDVVSETALKGTVRCETLSGQQKVPVVVRFSLD
ncbi:MAG TPA: hypothetical protein VFJ98_08255 [Mycobacteriales bacterium]|nr:hypothetical protein [Mycobacteriales bacterium]